MNLTDIYIQKRIQGGDIKEFEKLFHKYYQPLCLHAFKILNDMDLAEDIVQEFFYQCWKNRQNLHVTTSINAYFYEAIRKNSLHYIEHLNVRKQYAEQAHNSETEMEDGGQLQEIGLIELNKIVNLTLERLPDRCSRIFKMNRFEGKKYREIAVLLSISVKTVEADMGKALQFFRETLQEYRNITSKA